MLIDFHTHIFPEQIAKAAISKLESELHIPANTDGTYLQLQKSCRRAGIDLALVLPIATSPRQYQSIIRYADSINHKYYADPSQGILSLASIHPDCQDIDDKLKEIKALGFAGIKLHPDFQQTMFSDIRYKRILSKASELDLFVVTHAGLDPYSANLIHCDVPSILEVLKDVAPRRLILAHMGNNTFYDEVEKYLMGADVYLDMAYSIIHQNPDQMLRMIRKHGPKRILFATDTPWVIQEDAVSNFKKLPLTEYEYERISHINAEKLLGILPR